MDFVIQIFIKDEIAYKKFQKELESNGFKLRGSKCKTRYIQNDIFMLGLKKFLDNPKAILEKYRKDQEEA
ncbi:MAG: hypothetical protein SVR08_16285 [Spirochaetota bacterium]|nr:hypothetical protein [Spirochaetota bacterium]